MTRGGPPAWGLVKGLTTPHRKKKCFVLKLFTKPRNGIDSLVRPRQTNKDMRFGTWNVRTFYRTGAVTLVAQELAKYRLDLVGYSKLGEVDINDTWENMRCLTKFCSILILGRFTPSLHT